MKKKLVSVILAAVLVCTNMSVVSAAEISAESVQETVQEEVLREAKAANQLTADQISGMFVSFGDKTVSSVTDKNLNRTLTIPDGILIEKNASVQMLMQNIPAMGITGLTGNTYDMSFDLGSAYNLDDYLGQVKNFGQAVISGKVGGVSYSYQVKGSRSGQSTVIQAVSSDAATAYQELAKYIKPATGLAANGAGIEKNAWLEVGNDKLEFNPGYTGDLIFGNGDISFGDYEQDVRDYFLYKEGASSKTAQINLFIPKNSYMSLGGKSGVLTQDVLVEVTGLADGYDTLGANDVSLLYKMAHAQTRSELLASMLQSVNEIAKSAEGRNVNVNIRFPSVIEATQVKLDVSSLKLDIGESHTLTATILPEGTTDQSLTWTSSNPSVAKVVNGKVTGLKNGTAIITVTTANGLKVECKVTVRLGVPKKFRVVNGTANATKLKLAWRVTKGAKKYEIYRSTKPKKGFKKIATIRSTNYIDTQLKTGTRYYYKIKAYGNGVYSAFTEVSSGIPTLKAPDLVGKRRKKAALLEWNELTYADGYQVFMKKAKKGKFKKVATVRNGAFKKSRLKSRRTYYFRVRGLRRLDGKTFYGFYSDTVKVKVK